MPGWPPGKLTAAAASIYRKKDAAAEKNPFISAVIAVTGGAVEVWPENWPVLMLFCDLSTQWNVQNRPVGLRYEAIYPLLDRRYPDPEEWEQVFEDLRVLERAALEAMSENT